MTSPNYFTSGKIAELCDVHPSTVENWMRDGKIKTFRLPGGLRRVTAEDLQAFLVEYNIPVAAPTRRRKPVVLFAARTADELDSLAVPLGKTNRYLVRTAPTIFDALIVAGVELPDVIVLDLDLTAPDPFKLVAAFKQAPGTKDALVIGLAARLTASKQRKATESGAVCYAKAAVTLDFASLLDAVLLKISRA